MDGNIDSSVSGGLKFCLVVGGAIKAYFINSGLFWILVQLIYLNLWGDLEELFGILIFGWDFGFIFLVNTFVYDLWTTSVHCYKLRFSDVCRPTLGYIVTTWPSNPITVLGLLNFNLFTDSHWLLLCFMYASLEGSLIFSP